MINVKAKNQDLTFYKLFGYYGSRGIKLDDKTFKNDLGLLTEEDEYNLLAQLLSDDSNISIKVEIYQGETRESKVVLCREFGRDCLLYSIDNLLRYLDVLNVNKADETNRIVERKEIPLFSQVACDEAVVNAIMHNKWIDGIAPSIAVFTNRIEIISSGSIGKGQTLAGFFAGKSVPVNQNLYKIYLMLNNKKPGRGVPTISALLGYETFKYDDGEIVVTIPYNWSFNKNDNIQSIEYKELDFRKRQLMIAIKHNKNIRKAELAKTINVCSSTIDNYLTYLKKEGYVEHIGSNKKGYWQILK